VLVASSVGISTMVMGLVAIPIIVFLGAAADRVGYGVSIRLSGIIAIIGGIMFYVITIIAAIKRRRNQPPPPSNNANVDTMESDTSAAQTNLHIALLSTSNPPSYPGGTAHPTNGQMRKDSHVKFTDGRGAGDSTDGFLRPKVGQGNSASDQSRWSKQDFRWSRIPTAPESNI